MRHQIALVGGQTLPIFLGVKEYNPDKVHFIVTNESNDKLNYLRNALGEVETCSYFCDPYDVKEIKTICENIISSVYPDNNVSFNLTGGTKLMLIAAQAVLIENKLSGFYLNIGNMVTEIPAYLQHKLSYKINTEDFLKLSGHIMSSNRRLESYNQADLDTAKAIQHFSGEGNAFSLIGKHFRDRFKKIRASGHEIVNENLECIWSLGKVTIRSSSNDVQIFESPFVKELFFYGGWWELLVAKAVARWDTDQEILMQIIFPFKTDLKTSKNEVDVLINRNNKLIFVECKSGIVTQQDINKIKTIKDTYGGNASKSILVSQFKPQATLFEKCKELSIEVFYMISEDGSEEKSFDELISDLKVLDQKLSL
jgi:hypothetical protein